ncbi:hypothetical protein ACLK1X_01865 [Escherichia coli]
MAAQHSGIGRENGVMTLQSYTQVKSIRSRRLSSSPYSNQEVYLQFDYIIIGAGSAGNVLATRLTEDPNTSVLLLEAGGPDYRFIRTQMPAARHSRYRVNATTGPMKRNLNRL